MDKVYLISQKQLEIIKSLINSLSDITEVIDILNELSYISDDDTEYSDDIFDYIETANNYIINDTKDAEFVINDIEYNQLVTELPYNSEKYNINMNITNKYSMGNLRKV